MMSLLYSVMLAIGSSLAAMTVVKATIAMTLGLLGARFARKSRAAARHALLAASFGVLLVLPVAALVAPPVRIVALTVPQNRPAPLSFATVVDAVPPVVTMNGSSGQSPANARLPRLSLSTVLIVLWLAGAIMSLLPTTAALWRIRSLRRSGLPWLRGQSIVEGLAVDAGVHRRVDVLLHETISGPMTCGAAHPAIVLPPDAQTWALEDLSRAMVHELEHVRRGDHVSHCLASIARAAYWFHPLVWIASRQFALEAERACDDAVLRRFEATAYADQLVGLARRISVAAKSPLVAMANRADLAARVRAVLDNGQRRGRAGTLPLILSCAGAAGLVVTVSPLRVVAAPQTASVQTAVQAMPEFDAVSVKLVDPDMKGSHFHASRDPGRISLAATMHSLVLRAYGITSGQLGNEPGWFKTRSYSIEAVTANPAGQREMMLMLRRVLADRFRLELRQEHRDLPVYVLEIAANGPKFRALKAGEEPRDPPQSAGMFARSFNTLKDLLNALNGLNGGKLAVDRPVVDRTGLDGEYNIQIQTEIETQTDAPGRSSSQLPNLFHDIQSELGLRLVSDHLEMPYFVVEHAAAPTLN